MGEIYFSLMFFFLQLSNKVTTAIELPGLIFMLREIFPHIHSWRFERESDRQRIYTIVLQYFLDILQMPISTSDNRNEYRMILRKICVRSLMNLDNGMTLLR